MFQETATLNGQLHWQKGEGKQDKRPVDGESDNREELRGFEERVTSAFERVRL